MDQGSRNKRRFLRNIKEEPHQKSTHEENADHVTPINSVVNRNDLQVCTYQRADLLVNPSSLHFGISTHSESSGVVKEFNSLFVLKSWGLLQSQQFLTQVYSTYGTEQCFIDELISVLSGKVCWQTNNELIKFVHRKPEVWSGIFITAINVIGYCISTPIKDVLSLWDTKHALRNDNLIIVLKKTLVYLLQRHLRKSFYNPQPKEEIPPELYKELKFGFVDMKEGFIQPIVTLQEIDCTTSLKNILTDLLFQDLTTNQAYLLDPGINVTDRGKRWIKILDALIAQLHYQEKLPVFDFLLLSDLKYKESTIPYLRVETENGVTTVQFHPEVVHRFGKGQPNINNVAVGTLHDIYLLTMLLYKQQKTDQIFTRLTYEVFCMARSIGITDIWNMIYKEENFPKYVTQENKISLFKICISLQQVHGINYMLQNIISFPQTLDKMYYSVCNGLPRNHFTFFLREFKLRITDLVKYYLILSWTFDLYKLDYNLRKPMFHQNVKKVFDSLKHFINLNNLEHQWPMLCEQRYFSILEILQVRKPQNNNN